MKRSGALVDYASSEDEEHVEPVPGPVEQPTAKSSMLNYPGLFRSGRVKRYIRSAIAIWRKQAIGRDCPGGFVWLPDRANNLAGVCDIWHQAIRPYILDHVL